VTGVNWHLRTAGTAAHSFIHFFDVSLTNDPDSCIAINQQDGGDGKLYERFDYHKHDLVAVIENCKIETRVILVLSDAIGTNHANKMATVRLNGDMMLE
jgi:hypothetical protein